MKQTAHSERRWVATSIVLALLSLTGKAISPQQQSTQITTASTVTDVSMIALLASPQQYEGRLVRTSGFLCIEFEGDALYLHKEDYRYGLTKNSFRLRLSKLQREQFKNLSSHYVLIEGTVYANGPETTDIWSGALGMISRLENWPIDRGAKPHK